jgi:hypothetical protein
MTLEADWGLSTVLEAFRAASTARFPVPEECLAALATRSSATAPRRRVAPGGRSSLGTAHSKSESEIRNPKFRSSVRYH